MGPAEVLKPSGTLSECLCMQNMVTEDDVKDPEIVKEIEEDVKEECEEHGKVLSCSVDPARRLVFVRFADTSSSEKAAGALCGRFFAGRRIEVAYISADEF